jgi:hypothetical protein
MRRTLVSIAATAAVLLAGLSIASANRLVINDDDYKIIWDRFEIATPLGTIECTVTFLGAFDAQTISKVIGAQIGDVSLADVGGGTCVGGSATILQASLPWDATYNSFSGTLPTIAGVELSLLGVSIQFRISSTTCLARTTTIEPGAGILIGDSGTHSLFVWDVDNVIDASDINGSSCDLFGVSIELAGTGTVEDSTGNTLASSLI